MTEPDAHPTVKTARDLTEILDLYARLRAHALNHASDRLMPGGHAMVALGKVANLEAWENMQQATERYGRAYTSVEDEDPDEAWSAYQLLEYWSEDWRRIHQAEYDAEEFKRTVATEANFIRSILDWAWDNEPRWDDFAADIRRARVRLENVVHAGKRADRARVVCDRCEDGPRLIHLRGRTEEDDRWKCPRCKHRFTHDEKMRAHARQLQQDGAARYVDQSDAIGTLKVLGRPERTIRKWLAPLRPKDECEECGELWPHQEYPACPKKDGRGEECGGMLLTKWLGDREALLEGYCEVGTRKTWVWWPSLWTRHLITQTRRREAS